MNSAIINGRAVVTGSRSVNPMRFTFPLSLSPQTLYNHMYVYTYARMYKLRIICLIFIFKFDSDECLAR